METQKQLKSSHLHMKDCLALNSHLGILQPTSYKPNILLSRNLMGGSRQIGYTELLKSFHLDIKYGHGLNSHLGILQTTSSNPYFLLSRKLMGVFKAKWRPRVALNIPFRYQRWTSTEQPSLNSSTNIFFSTIYPLEQILDGRLPATWRLRNC